MLLDRFSPDAAVLIDAATGTAVTRSEIENRAAKWGDHDGSLAFVMANGTIQSAIDLHALLAASRPVALLDASAPLEQTSHLIDIYRPAWVAASDDWAAPKDYVQLARGHWARKRDDHEAPIAPHPELAVLLTTSGSTGSPKFVRLASRNVQANARQIAQSLSLTPADRGVTALPVHYSFGMSILTSHAAAGSPVVVTSGSVIEPAFWEAMRDHEVTLLPGVPQTYQMLTRLRFTDRFLPMVPSLRALMQAGGRLHRDQISSCAEAMAARNGEFFVMYGQTEASPRIACLPPSRLPDKLGSAGVAVSGGLLEARGDDGQTLPPGEIGEIFYTGPNVMMGYAENQGDLTLGDVNGDTLATGDLGYLDEEGFLFLTGRAKRIAKVAGLRVSLDEVETMAAELGLADAIAVEAPEGVITLAVPATATPVPMAAVAELTRALRLPMKSLRGHPMENIPLLPNGKVDYKTLSVVVLEATVSERGSPERGPSSTGENQP